MQFKEPWNIIRLLAFTQISAWGSLYYAFAVVAPDIQRELGWRGETVFGVYSWSLLVAGLASTPVGILLDRFGGRMVMACGSLLAAAGLGLLANVHSLGAYIAAWTLIGVAMAMVLYEAAFATINREFHLQSRKAISVLTLFGGLASTVSWPLTLWLSGRVGWRDTFLIYAAVQALLCAPMHLLLPAGRRAPVPPPDARMEQARNFTLREAVRHPVFWKLAFAFATNMFIFSALSVHLIALLQRFGHAAAGAVLMASLIGPMQVAGRMAEMSVANRFRPQTVGILTFSFLPLALMALLFAGERQYAVAIFCVLYGVSNGVLTIVRGTVPQALFGRENYGAISGALAGPSLLAKAAGPIVAASIIAAHPGTTVLLAGLLAVSAASLMCFLSAIRGQAAMPELRST
ncbi:MFS transporter [Noviherbaspirillum sp. 17J57-3]|uniref:MFS transporter n=2 Tax=Noviherbaspirillum galbum TaxID=2709383 RepID=A0A6B3SYH1_9BURK|nr:MFS transporter [Noviherbaspirillum galbum]